MTPEGTVKKAITDLLNSYGPELYYFKPVQSGYGQRTVDIIVCFRGIFIAVEVKRKGQQARKFQEHILSRIKLAGGEALCIDNLTELKALLDYFARHEIRLVERPPLRRT